MTFYFISSVLWIWRVVCHSLICLFLILGTVVFLETIVFRAGFEIEIGGIFTLMFSFE